MENTNLFYCALTEVFDYAKKTAATAVWRKLRINNTIIGEMSNIIIGGINLRKGTKIGSVIRIKNRITGFINDINHEKIIRITIIKE